MNDPNVEAVREKLLSRSEVGIQKYCTTTAEAGLSRLQWLQHLQEELMDACVYIEAAMRDPTENRVRMAEEGRAIEAAFCERERRRADEAEARMRRLMEDAVAANQKMKDAIEANKRRAALQGQLWAARFLMAPFYRRPKKADAEAKDGDA
jgi:hypothetical protein